LNAAKKKLGIVIGAASPRDLTISNFSLAVIKKSQKIMAGTKKFIKLDPGPQLFIIFRELENEVNGKKRQPHEEYQNAPSTRAHNVDASGLIPFYILVYPDCRTNDYNTRDYRWQQQRY